MSYRATPLQIGYSPSELLMGRKLRTTVPVTRNQLIQKLPDRTLVRKRDEQEKQRQERSFNKRHRARELSELDPGDIVWVPDRTSEWNSERPDKYEVLRSGDGRRSVQT